MATHKARLLSFTSARAVMLIGLLGLAAPLHTHAGDAPWDQGHNTTDFDNDDAPGSDEGPDCGNTQGSPVFVASGDLIWRETDINIRGRTPLTLTRSYNSHDPRDGLFGKGWVSNCEPMLIAIDPQTMPDPDGDSIAYLLREGTGRRHPYTWSDDRSRINPPPWRFDRIEPQSDGSARLTNLDGSYRLFDAQGRLLQKVDRNGNTVSYRRDAVGRLTRESDSAGRYLDYSYDSTGHVASVTDHSGRSWQYAYNTEGALISVTDPVGGVRRYTYQSYDTVETPNSGTFTTYQQLTRVTDESGVERLGVTYTERRVSTYTMATNTYTYTYPRTTARITNTLSKRDSAGSLWSYLYDDDDGQITQRTDPLGRNEQWRYDNHSLVAEYTDQSGQRWRYEHDNLGRQTQHTDPLDRQTQWQYLNDTPWPIKITSPSGRVTTIEYDPQGNPTTLTDASGAVTRMEYSALGDLTAIIDASSQRTEIRYTAAGLPDQYQDPLGRVSQFEYDSLSRLINTINPAGESQQTRYDALDRITAQTDGLNHTSDFAYDASGRLLSVTDANDNAIGAYLYDPFGRIASATEAGIAYVYSYNSNNTLASLTEGDVTTTYTFDRKRQLLRQRSARVSLSYRYDPNGRITRIIGNGAAVAYTYDAAGQRTSETQGSRNIDLTYNRDGELNQYTHASNPYQLPRDSRGQLTSLITPAGEYSLTHDPRGLLTQLTPPNGQQQSFAYDAAAQLTRQDYSQSGGITYDYQYDQASRLTQASGDSTRQYGFDAASRLTSASHDNTSYNYNYDPVGNRSEDSQQHDTANRLDEDTTYSYQYDTRGNLSQKTNKASGARSDYSHNGLNQLTVFEHYPDSTATTADITARYVYDTIGRRIRKTVGSQTTEYHWLGSQLIAEYQRGQVTKIYSYTQGYAPVEVQEGTNTYTVHADHLDTPRYLTDQSGQIVWQNLPDPYGISEVNEDPDGDGNNVSFNIRFPGQYFDAETRLHYNYFRDYDPSIGRYVQSDSIGLLGGVNTYVYVGGNPITRVDPTGTIFIINAGGGIFGFVSGGIGAFVTSGGDIGSALQGAVIGGVIGVFNPVGGILSAFRGGVLSNISGQAIGNATTCNDLLDLDFELALASGIAGAGGTGLTRFLSNPGRSAFAFNAQRRFGPPSPIAQGLTNSVIEGLIVGTSGRLGAPSTRSNNCECR